MTEIALRDALPASFVVGRRGTPLPPDSRYFVLDLVYDFESRAALARLGRRYADAGQAVRAQECWAALEGSKDAHAAACERKHPRVKTKRSTAS